MYASIIDATFKPESRDEAVEMADKLVEELNGKVEGLKAFVTIDNGDDTTTSIAFYDSKEHFEAAASSAQEVLGKLGPFMAAMPERRGSELLIAKRFD
jgi:hypothetical protein